MPRVRSLTSAACAAVLLLPAAAEAAGTYTAFACKGPDGAANTAPGWGGANVFAGITANDCARGGSLSAVLPGRPTGGTSAAWRFLAPPATRIVRLRAERATRGVARGAKATDLSYLLSLDGRTLERCDVSDTSPCTADLGGVVEKEGLDGSDLQFRLTCQGGGDEQCSGELRLDVARVAIGLADAAAPVLREVRVADDGERSGVLRVAFDATDEGGGVFRALTLVDGVVRAVTPLGGPSCADAAPGDADPYQFVEPRPCPAAVDDAAVALDVRTLPPGPHVVEVRVEDAAGNAASALTTEFPRLNAAPATAGASLGAVLRGRLTAWFVESGTQRLRSRFGRRVVVRGRLTTPAGRGITGARIDVVHVLPGGRRLPKTGLKTRPGGAFTLILPRDLRTRRIELAFRAVRPGPVTSQRTMSLRVTR